MSSPSGPARWVSLTRAPRKPYWVTQRRSSAAASSGLCIERVLCNHVSIRVRQVYRPRWHSRKRAKSVGVRLDLLSGIVVDLNSQRLRLLGIEDVLHTGCSVRQNRVANAVLISVSETSLCEVLDLLGVLLGLVREQACPPLGLLLQTG